MVKALSFLDIKGYLVTEFGFYRDMITNIYYSLSPSAGITQRKPSKFQSLIEYTFFNKFLDKYFKQVLNDIDPDIVISLVPYPFIAKIVKKNGYLYVYWNIDDPTNFGIEPLWNAKLADVTFTIAPGMIKIYEKYGCKNVFWLMLAADPGLFKPMKVQKEFDVVFIGNFTLDKLKGFKQLLFPIFKRSNGIKVRIFGARWPTNARWYRGFLQYKYIPLIYSQSKLVINIHTDIQRFSPLTFNMRMFEAMACGACLISDYIPGSEFFFKNYKHYILLKTPVKSYEYLRLLESLLENNNLREEIGMSARENIIHSHTYIHRALRLTQIIGNFI